MKQQLSEYFHAAISNLQQNGTIQIDELPPVQIERTRDTKFGDFACNIAMMLAKPCKANPRQLAENIVAALPASELIKEVQIAGPGFINCYLHDNAYQHVVERILETGVTSQRPQVEHSERVHIEIVSANPTGPLHVGHGRLAAYGATLANLLEAVGHQVHREYYVNDAGRQMHILAVSIWLRYLEQFGQTIQFPSNGYKGDYVIDIAKAVKVEHEEQFLHQASEVLADLPDDPEKNIDEIIARAQNLLGEYDYHTVFEAGLESILNDIADDLADFGVQYQEWFHESELVSQKLIENGVERLRKANTLFEKDGATWFKATDFGDEKDRVVVRENGNHTYFAADVGYHLNKFERGFTQVIDVFGADHHGYGPRLYALLQAAGEKPEGLKILLVQFAILYRGKEKVSMSTRAGEFVTLRELRKEVGNDAARYFYIMRKRDQHLDFDLELAKSRSNENPVYYIQYAYARICSVMRQLEQKQLDWDEVAGIKSLHRLTQSHEIDLMRCLSRYSETLDVAAQNYEPHMIANYLQELANHTHSYYNAHQFLVDDAELRYARLSLIAATREVIADGLQLLGVSAPEQM